MLNYTQKTSSYLEKITLRMIIETLLICVAVYIIFFLFSVVHELAVEIKFEPDALISVNNKQYLITRQAQTGPHQGTRGGYNYYVNVVIDGKVQADIEPIDWQGGSSDMHSCNSIRLEGNYLVVKDNPYCPGSSLLYYLIPSAFFGGEIKRFKLI